MKEIKLIKRLVLYLFILMTLVVGTTDATGTPGLKFEYLTLRDGLSQSSVNCITQDSTGFLWFGTQSGLNRYDGYEFVVFKHNPFDHNSISNDWVQVMVETEPGVLWLGTWTEGLNRFDTVNKKVTRFTHTPGDKNGLLHNSIRAIVRNSSGGLWIGTKGGLDYLAPDLNTFHHYIHDPADTTSLSEPEITAIYENNQGTIWVGTANGLNRMNRETGKFTRFFHNPADPGSLSGNNITAIMGDFRGNLWVGTKSSGLNLMVYGQDGLTHFRHDPKDSDTLCSDSISSLLVDGNGCVWVGTGNVETHGNGLTRLSFIENTGQWELTNYEYRPHGISPTSLLSPYLSDRTILSIYEDRGGGL